MSDDGNMSPGSATFAPKQTSTTIRNPVSDVKTRQQLRNIDNQNQGKVLFRDNTGAENVMSDQVSGVPVILATPSHGEWDQNYSRVIPDASKTLAGSRMNVSMDTNVSFNTQNKEVTFKLRDDGNTTDTSEVPHGSGTQTRSSDAARDNVQSEGGAIDIASDLNEQRDNASEASAGADDNASVASAPSESGSGLSAGDDKTILFRIVRVLLKSIVTTDGVTYSNLLYLVNPIQLFNNDFYMAFVGAARVLGVENDVIDYSNLDTSSLPCDFTWRHWRERMPQLYLASDIYAVADKFDPKEFETKHMLKLYKQAERLKSRERSPDG